MLFKILHNLVELCLLNYITYNTSTKIICGNYPFGKIVGGEPFCGVVLVHLCDLVGYILVLQTSFMIFEQFKAPVEVEKFISG